MEKYDLNKVKAHLSQGLEKDIREKKCDKNEVNTLMKSYTRNGYKIATFICFGEAAKFISEYRSGTIWAIINPRVLPPKSSDQNYGYTFSIDNEQQLMMIGYSEEYGICAGNSNTNTVTQHNTFDAKKTQCRLFLNKSVETLCDQHKIERKIAQFSRFRAGRLNTMGEGVDIHHIKKMQKMEEENKHQLAFMRSER